MWNAWAPSHAVCACTLVPRQMSRPAQHKARHRSCQGQAAAGRTAPLLTTLEPGSLDLEGWEAIEEQKLAHRAALAERNPCRAAALFEAALQRWPDNLHFPVSAAVAAGRRGDLAAARRLLRTAVERWPDHSVAWPVR